MSENKNPTGTSLKVEFTRREMDELLMIAGEEVRTPEEQVRYMVRSWASRRWRLVDDGPRRSHPQRPAVEVQYPDNAFVSVPPSADK